MMRDQPMTTVVGNTLGRINVSVWPKGDVHAWNITFRLSIDEALSLAKELTAAAALGPRVVCAADLGMKAA